MGKKTAIKLNGDLAYIAIEKLEPNELNDADTDKIEELTKSILNDTLITPLTVIGPSIEGKYKLVSDHRRLLALKSIREQGKEPPRPSGRNTYISKKSIQLYDFVQNFHFNRIPCYIAGSYDMEPTDQQLLLVAGNLNRADENTEEQVSAYMKIFELVYEKVDRGELKPHEVISACTSYTAITPRQLRNYKALYERDNEDLIEAVKNRLVRADKIYSFAKLSDPVIKDVLKKARERIENGNKTDPVVRGLLHDVDQCFKVMSDDLKTAIDAGEASILNYLVDESENENISEEEESFVASDSSTALGTVTDTGEKASAENDRNVYTVLSENTDNGISDLPDTQPAIAETVNTAAADEDHAATGSIKKSSVETLTAIPVGISPFGEDEIDSIIAGGMDMDDDERGDIMDDIFAPNTSVPAGYGYLSSTESLYASDPMRMSDYQEEKQYGKEAAVIRFCRMLLDLDYIPDEYMEAFNLMQETVENFS